MFGMILILEKGSGGSLQVYLVLSLERWMERRGAGSWGWVERDNWLNTEDGRLGGLVWSYMVWRMEDKK